MDIKSPKERHANMSAIHAKDTKPELIVRKFLWSNGYRYRLNVKRLPGSPDIVLRKYRTCIFVNGCFWHGHDSCKYFKMPKTNVEFWTKKIERNKERDIVCMKRLAAIGWHTMTIWECELKPKRREETLISLDYTLNHIYLMDRSVNNDYEIAEEGQNIAAEPTSEYNQKLTSD